MKPYATRAECVAFRTNRGDTEVDAQEICGISFGGSDQIRNGKPYRSHNYSASDPNFVKQPEPASKLSALDRIRTLFRVGKALQGDD